MMSQINKEKTKKKQAQQKEKEQRALLFLISFYNLKYHNPKQINCFYERPSVKFERLMQFAKAEPKPDAPSSPIQLQLFKY
ncbi:hypothetical protein TTHERM_00805800 (macronuclear) [Tetrahymena thermophila SB210]|uniref:Transmembrane protein n=1 Tax=Tetrahymena thermophila (strain SB210) TaxID=312017 RepID=Q233U5_TETTS|nr:hypothetical protein TTHERM_00805800 [Tetrahymena thermophila SB210]EAR91734.1 hypothetical protein TTHERM_00805800 [Tetrahymena thermophila SB210]|eukprot:XP_001011979.1 hypothetical protein TTHERM_00805800 [Tetrahymena thermophila SB210]